MSQADSQIHNQEIRSEVENKELGQEKPKSNMAADVEKDSYKIVLFLGSELPQQYKNLIYTRWLRTLRYGNEYFKLIDPKIYYSTYEKCIIMFLMRPNTLVRVAVLADDPDVALGFSVSEGNILHYVHTQKDMLRQGIARSLVPFEVKTITHLTKTGMMLWSTKLPGAIFNPFQGEVL